MHFNAGKTVLHNVDSCVWDSTFSYFDLQLRNDIQYFDEIFRKEALRHGEHAYRISLSENGCYGVRN